MGPFDYDLNVILWSILSFFTIISTASYERMTLPCSRDLRFGHVSCFATEI